ncbi:hypothetical protein ACOMHN_037018 [Nucella lapillus]
MSADPDAKIVKSLFRNSARGLAFVPKLTHHHGVRHLFCSTVAERISGVDTEVLCLEIRSEKGSLELEVTRDGFHVKRIWRLSFSFSMFCPVAA